MSTNKFLIIFISCVFFIQNIGFCQYVSAQINKNTLNKNKNINTSKKRNTNLYLKNNNLQSIHSSFDAKDKIKKCKSYIKNKDQLKMLDSDLFENTYSRIVSLSLASDEILYELLYKTNKLKTLIAVSNVAFKKEFSYLADKFSNNQSFLNSNSYVPKKAFATIEQVIKLKPDLLIVASFNNQKLLNSIQNLKKEIKIVRLTDFNTVDQIISNLMFLALLTKTCHYALDHLDKTLNIIKTLVVFNKNINHKPKVIYYDKWGYFIGKKTLFDDLMNNMGFLNVISQTGWSKLTASYVIKIKPDYIIAPCFDQDKHKDKDKVKKFNSIHLKNMIIKKLKNNAIWQHMPAVINQKIICVDKKALMSTSTYLYQAYLQIKNGFYQIVNNNDNNKANTSNKANKANKANHLNIK